MDTESLKTLFENLFAGFDLTAFLPELTTLLGWIELFLRLAVMAGPLLMLGFGLVYLFAPPKEANHSLGYRFWWGMSSLDAWRFTQRVAGIGWTVLGVILTVVMAVLCNGFRRMEPMDMVWSAVAYLGWELGLMLAACVIVDIIVVVVFDRQGYRRPPFSK